MNRSKDNARGRVEWIFFAIAAVAFSVAGCAHQRSAEIGYPVSRSAARAADVGSPSHGPRLYSEDSMPTATEQNSAEAKNSYVSDQTNYPPPLAEEMPSPSPPLAMQAASQPLAAPVEVARVDPRPAPKAIKRTVIHANEATFASEVLQAEEAVLVDFYAHWCGPCNRLAPTLDEVAAESPRGRVVKVNIEDSPELAARYGVKSLPTLLVFKDGQVVSRQKGVVDKARLHSMLDL